MKATDLWSTMEPKTKWCRIRLLFWSIENSFFLTARTLSRYKESLWWGNWVSNFFAFCNEILYSSFFLDVDFLTFCNISQNFSTFTTFHNIHNISQHSQHFTTFTTFCNIRNVLQHSQHLQSRLFLTTLMLFYHSRAHFWL